MPTNEFLNVRDYGASPNASSFTNSQSFQTAYMDAAIGGTIVVPAGSYTVIEPSGSKPVRWITDGATNAAGNPLSLPGTITGLFENRFLVQKTAAGSDQQPVLDIVVRGSPGGYYKNVATAQSVYYSSPEGQTCGAWTQTLVMDNWSTNLDTQQVVGQEIVAKQNVKDGTTVYGQAIEAGEYHNQGNPRAHLCGAEIATIANKSDDYDSRTTLFLAAQKRFTEDPEDAVFAKGLFLKTGPGSKYKTGFFIEGNYDYIFRSNGSSSNIAVFDIQRDTSGQGLAMGGHQRLLWRDPQNAEIASLRFENSGRLNITTASQFQSGGTQASNVAFYMPVMINGQPYRLAFYPA